MSFRSPYPRYDVLEKWNSPSWNDATRRVVRARMEEVPARRFFTEDEWNLLQAVVDRLVPQPDRPSDPVPIVPWVDDKLHRNVGDGYRYADMPPMREAWRRGLDGIAREARRRHGADFGALDAERQDDVLRAIDQGDVSGEPWDAMPAHRFFKHLLLTTVVLVYYAHPAAWSEAGFGGPAGPRGYVRLEADRRDPWEAERGDGR